MFPKILKPKTVEQFLIDGNIVEVPKSRVSFKLWEGVPFKHKPKELPILNFKGKAMFAQLAILNLLSKHGWNVSWIIVQEKTPLTPIFLNQWIDLPLKNQINQPISESYIRETLNEVANTNNGNFMGCWDLFAWKDDGFLFVETKQSKIESIESSKNKWIKAAFKYGLNQDNFLIVEWEAKNNI